MELEKWSFVEQNLTKKISPFVYGRHLQMVIDLSSHDKKPDRRYRIWGYVSKLSPDEIIKEAEGIAKKYNKLSNGFNQLETDHPNILIENEENIFLQKYSNKTLCNPDKAIYLGRCCQFLLDTDRKKYKINDILLWDVDDLEKTAHKVKQDFLLRQHGAFYVDCNCDNDCEEHDDGDCQWYYDNSRCECGNMRFAWSGNDYAESLDDTDVYGYPEPL